MKNNNINLHTFLKTFVLILIMTSTASVSAQPSFDDDVEDGIPLDGGLSLLVAGAAAYGIKKLRGNKSDANK